MEFTQVVENRYSCKNFSGRKVEAEKLQVILEAGRVAPTAKNLQEQRVYVVQSEEGLKKIDAVTPCRYGAPTCLVVAFDKNHVFTYPGEKRDSGVEDASIVATHMMLAAANAGVDSCWLNFFDPDKAAKELGLPENEEVLMILDLGYAAEGVGPLPNHASHKANEEIYGVLSGKGKVVIDGEEISLAAGDWLKISPVAKRQFFAASNSEITYICIQVKENSLEGYTATDAVIY